MGILFLSVAWNLCPGQLACTCAGYNWRNILLAKRVRPLDWMAVVNTWYKMETWCHKITPVEVVKETAQQVVYTDTRYARQERRALKVSDSEGYYPTWAEAKAALVAYHTGRVEQAEIRAAYARTELEEAKAVQES